MGKDKLTQEHKDKIGQANRIALRNFHNKHPNYKNNGMFKKGEKSIRKGKQFPNEQMENHYKWVGGTHASARRIAERYGFNLSKCSICEKNDRTIVHHVDENENNNELKNLRILCFRCHNQLHGCGYETRFKKGHKVSKEIRMKISKANKGCKAWNKGIKVDRNKYAKMGNFGRNF